MCVMRCPVIIWKDPPDQRGVNKQTPPPNNGGGDKMKWRRCVGYTPSRCPWERSSPQQGGAKKKLNGVACGLHAAPVIVNDARKKPPNEGG